MPIGNFAKDFKGPATSVYLLVVVTTGATGVASFLQELSVIAIPSATKTANLIFFNLIGRFKKFAIIHNKNYVVERNFNRAYSTGYV